MPPLLVLMQLGHMGLHLRPKASLGPREEKARHHGGPWAILAHKVVRNGPPIPYYGLIESMPRSLYTDFLGCGALAWAPRAIRRATRPSTCPVARFFDTLRLPAGSISMAALDTCHRSIGWPP